MYNFYSLCLANLESEVESRSQRYKMVDEVLVNAVTTAHKAMNSYEHIEFVFQNYCGSLDLEKESFDLKESVMYFLEVI